MSKQSDREHVPVIGWFQPHRPVTWDGMIADPKTGELVKEPSMTKQSFKEECDINNIVRRFEATGVIDHLNMRAREGVYTDLPDPIDFQGALNVVLAAETAFGSLPADLRARFGNDAEQFLAFTADPANQEEMIKLGLAVDTRVPEAPPTKVEIVNQEPPKDPAK